MTNFVKFAMLERKKSRCEDKCRELTTYSKGAGLTRYFSHFSMDFEWAIFEFLKTAQALQALHGTAFTPCIRRTRDSCHARGEQ